MKLLLQALAFTVLATTALPSFSAAAEAPQGKPKITIGVYVQRLPYYESLVECEARLEHCVSERYGENPSAEQRTRLASEIKRAKRDYFPQIQYESLSNKVLQAVEEYVKESGKTGDISVSALTKDDLQGFLNQDHAILYGINTNIQSLPTEAIAIISLTKIRIVDGSIAELEGIIAEKPNSIAIRSGDGESIKFQLLDKLLFEFLSAKSINRKL